jgi:predicted PurR-regulated permease PerM
MVETVRRVGVVNGPAPAPWGLPPGVIVLIGLAAAVVTVAGIRATAGLIGPAFLALTIVIAISPVQGWLLRKGLPRWVSVLALVLGCATGPRVR